MGAVPVDLGIVRDKETTLKGAVLAALHRCDVLVTSGGVSMGEADLLKPILEVCVCGLSLCFWVVVALFVGRGCCFVVAVLVVFLWLWLWLFFY